MTEKNLNTGSNSVETSKNIFDEFSTDSSLINEVEKLKEEQNKDFFYYILKGTNLVKMLLLIIIITIVFSGTYIYIQNNKDISNS